MSGDILKGHILEGIINSIIYYLVLGLMIFSIVYFLLACDLFDSYYFFC